VPAVLATSDGVAPLGGVGGLKRGTNCRGKGRRSRCRTVPSLAPCGRLAKGRSIAGGVARGALARPCLHAKTAAAPRARADRPTRMTGLEHSDLERPSPFELHSITVPLHDEDVVLA